MRAELLDTLRGFPDPKAFLALLAAWIVLFHFLGNSVLGYIDTQSLFGWWWHVGRKGAEDQLSLFIPPLVLILLWLRRAEWASVPKAPWAWGLLLVVVGLLFHLTGFVVQQTRLSIIGFMVGLYGILGILWGPRLLRAILYPYGLLVFAVPLGAVSDALTSPLRLLVSVLSTGFCNVVLGLDVLRTGSLIYDSQGTFQYDVAPACSGIRSLTALLLLMTIYGFMTYRTMWRRVLVVALSVPLAIFGNTLRLIIVIIAGEAFGQDAGTAIEQKLGFLTFAVALGVILLLGHWLREPPDAEPASSTLSRPPADSGGRL